MHPRIFLRSCALLLSFGLFSSLESRAQSQGNKPAAIDTTASRPKVTTAPPAAPPGPKAPPRPGLPPPPVPVRSKPVDVETAALDPKVVAKVKADFEDWKRNGGAEHGPSLVFFHGRPFLMLMAPANEAPAAQIKRKTAIVDVCAQLLDGQAFPHAVVTVVETQPGNKGEKVHNSQVSRTAFESSVRSAGKSADTKAAVAIARADHAAVGQICTDLGIR